jgi:hypothetical protein
MIAHMPIPQFQVVLARTAAVMSPDTQVLICHIQSAKSKTNHGETHNEGQGRDEGEEESSSSRGQIRDNDFGEQHDHGVTDLVDYGTATEGRDAIRSGLDNSADDVEDDADNDEFESTEDVTNFGGRGLKRGCQFCAKTCTDKRLTCAAAAMTDRRTLMVESKECVLGRV